MLTKAGRTSVPNNTEVVISGLATVRVESKVCPDPLCLMMELMKQGSVKVTVNWIEH
jgi:hypothetical protein